MNIRLLAFGIAKDILKQREITVEFKGRDLADLRQYLYDNYPKLAKLRTINFAVHDTYQDEAFVLTDDDEVVLIPPVSGG